MESRALDTLKIILKNRGVEDAQYEAVSNPIQETHNALSQLWWG
jgi:hypothetical protein